MSNFNINWLLENLQENSTIFYIGAANLHDAVNIKKAFPKSKFYAFECSRFWVDQFPILDEAKNANFIPVTIGITIHGQLVVAYLNQTKLWISYNFQKKFQ